MRPREHAAEIMQLRTKEERAARLSKVPESLRELVAKHVQIQFEMRKYRGNRRN